MDPENSEAAISSHSKPRTILFLDHTAALSGGELALYHLLIHLDRTKYTSVVVLSAPGPLTAKLAASEIETHILPLAENVTQTRKDSLKVIGLIRPRAWFQTLSYSIRLARFIRTRGVDLVHTNSLKADVLGGLAGRLAGVPVVWHIRDRIADDYLPRSMVFLFRWMCRILPDFVITNSSATLQTLALTLADKAAVIHGGITRTQARVVHDGVRKSDNSDRRDEGSDASVYEPVIGLVGRISPWKGQHIFLKAAALLRGRFPLARYHIVGSALFGEEAYEEEVRALCESLGLSDIVTWLGFRKDVLACIEEMDILVHASTTGEPFGQVVVEGMIASKPVVATRGGGVPEIVDDGVTGILVPMGEVEPMAEAIATLLSDLDRARDMGVAGRKRVLEHFTIEQTARKVESVYAQFWP